MAYYDALIAKWGTLSGTTAAKLTAVNALTVASPQPAVLLINKVVNAIVAADLIGLTTNQLLALQIILFGNSSVDGSPGTTVRAVFQSIFTGKTTTLGNLSTLVSPFDNATIPWWQATVAQGGGGLLGAVGQGDLDKAGLV